MYKFSIQTSVKKGRRIELNDSPFTEGDRVEVVILRLSSSNARKRYPLRSQAVHYVAPTDPVALDEWDAFYDSA